MAAQVVVALNAFLLEEHARSVRFPAQATDPPSWSDIAHRIGVEPRYLRGMTTNERDYISREYLQLVVSELIEYGYRLTMADVIFWPARPDLRPLPNCRPDQWLARADGPIRFTLSSALEILGAARPSWALITRGGVSRRTVERYNSGHVDSFGRQQLAAVVNAFHVAGWDVRPHHLFEF